MYPARAMLCMLTNCDLRDPSQELVQQFQGVLNHKTKTIKARVIDIQGFTLLVDVTTDLGNVSQKLAKSSDLKLIAYHLSQN